MSNDSKKVLIVEDEKPLARALELKLTHAGLVPTHAENGEKAIEFLDGTSFDVILLDLIMPNVDGFSVLQHLKEKGIETPVIVMTNLSQQEDEQRARDLGARDFFVKSNTAISVLVEKVQNILGL